MTCFIYLIFLIVLVCPSERAIRFERGHNLQVENYSSRNYVEFEAPCLKSYNWRGEGRWSGVQGQTHLQSSEKPGLHKILTKTQTDKKCLKVMTRFIIVFTTKHIVRLKYSFGNDIQCWDFITAWHLRNDCFLFYTCTLKKKWGGGRGRGGGKGGHLIRNYVLFLGYCFVWKRWFPKVTNYHQSSLITVSQRIFKNLYFLLMLLFGWVFCLRLALNSQRSSCFCLQGLGLRTRA